MPGDSFVKLDSCFFLAKDWAKVSPLLIAAPIRELIRVSFLLFAFRISSALTAPSKGDFQKPHAPSASPACGSACETTTSTDSPAACSSLLRSLLKVAAAYEARLYAERP